MKYLEWNDVIIDHFFNTNNEEKEVILYFSEIIIQEIGENNFPLPEGGYVEDFFKALRIGIPGTGKSDYIQRILDLNSRYKKGLKIDGVPFRYPPFFTYLMAFMLPFTSGEAPKGLRRTNFHDVVKNYFESKGLTDDYDGKIRLRLKEIDFLWDEIINWLFEENNFSLGIIETIDDPAPNRKYVSKFEYHILLRKEQEDRLSEIFDEKNILPNEPIDEAEIRRLLIENADKLRLSNNVVKKIRKNQYIGDKLVKRAFRYYKNWDGTNKYDYTKESGETTRRRAYSRKRLVTCVDFNILTQKIKFKYCRIYSVDGLPEQFILNGPNGNEFKEILQCTRNPSYSTPIENCFQNWNQSIEIRDSINKIKYTWKAKELYLFKRDSQLGDWIEIPQINFNLGTILIIAQKDFYKTNLRDWFEAEEIPREHKKLYIDSTRIELSDDWLAITIKNIANYPHSNIPSLKLQPEIKVKINFNKEFFFDASFFSDILPRVWVENMEMDNDLIYTEYKDGSKINLRKVNDSGFFEFTEENLKRKNQKFKIKYKTYEYPRFVKIIDFDSKLNNKKIQGIQPKRNLVGNKLRANERRSNYFQGIEHCFEDSIIQNLKVTQRNPVTKYSIFTNNRNASPFSQNYSYDHLRKGNILLNYISLKGKITKIEFDKAASLLLRKTDFQGNLKKQIRSSLYNLQDMGYLDYDSEQGAIYVNKSTVVIKPTKAGITLILVGARDNKLIKDIISYSRGGHCYVDIQNSTGKLMPQTILIKFKKSNLRIVEEFAKHFQLQFKNEGELFTQFALANANKLSGWKNFIKKATDLNLAIDFEGGESFNIKTLSFEPKSEDFNKKISFLRFQNINGYKTSYRLWYNGEAFHIAEQHYGIYLYLYLYRELKINEYSSEKKELRITQYEYKERERKLKSLTNILLYDKSKDWLGVPLNCDLPKYFAIAFTLLSGKNAEIREYKGQPYLVYTNIPFLFCNNSLVQTLEQQFDNNNKKQNLFL